MSAGDWNTHADMFLREVTVSTHDPRPRTPRLDVEWSIKSARSGSMIDVKFDSDAGNVPPISTRGPYPSRAQ